MPRYAEAPIHKVTFNMYKSDYEALIETYGRGWTETLREIIHQHVKTLSHEQEVGK